MYTSRSQQKKISNVGNPRIHEPKLRLNNREVSDNDILGVNQRRRHWSTILVSHVPPIPDLSLSPARDIARSIGIAIPHLPIPVDPTPYRVHRVRNRLPKERRTERVVLKSRDVPGSCRSSSRWRQSILGTGGGNRFDDWKGSSRVPCQGYFIILPYTCEPQG